MLLPAQYAWSEPVLIASIVVLLIGLVGNSITFSNRYISSLASAMVFAVVFGALTYSGLGSVSMTVKSPWTASTPIAK